MTDLDRTAEGDRPLDPDEVAGRTFATAFRGFDPVQVRAYLGTVADELRRLQGLLVDAVAAPVADEDGADVAGGVGGAASGEADAPSEPTTAEQADAVLEEARAEADRLVREARERVEQLSAAATAETSRVLEEARIEAARLRAHATDDLTGRFAEAEATAVKKIAEAEREAASIRVTAREESEATIEAARERGREMVAEAQAARERMLADLAKRKRAAQAQLEQLRAGRDRLLDTLKVARRSIDEMTNRFDADGGTTPPSSGTPSGAVTTTPGAAASEARPRAAAPGPPAVTSISTSPSPPPSSSGGDAPRPVRARAVAIGEAPQPAARPQIAAPQAAAATVPEREPEPAAVPEPEPAAVPEPPPREERRSSALRILRRGKAPADAAPPTPPLIGRDSPAEGVRIIGRPAAPPAEPEPEPEVAALEAVEVPPDVEPEPALDREVAAEPPSAPEAEPEVAAERPSAPEAEPEVAAVEAVVVTADPDPVPEVEPVEAVAATPDPGPEPPAPAASAEPLEPLAREEIRPRIEDLFARIRADREATTASARQVLATVDGPPTPETDEPSTPATQAPAAAPETDADEHRLQARDAITEPLVAQLTKRLKRALQDEQNAALDRLRTTRTPGTPTVDQVLAGPDQQTAPYAALAGPFLDQAAAAGARPAGPHGAAVATATDDLADHLAHDLADAVRTRLDAVLNQSHDEGRELHDVSERVSAVYREWKVQKVERLATHALVAAHERGAFLAHPEGTPLRWLIDDDGPCPDCEDNALAGPTPRGEAFPTGQLHPPAHLGCRCLLAPNRT